MTMTKDEIKAYVREVAETQRREEREAREARKAARAEAKLHGVGAGRLDPPDPRLVAFLEGRERVTVREVAPVIGLDPDAMGTSVRTGNALKRARWYRAGRLEPTAPDHRRRWFYTRQGTPPKR